MKKYGSETTVWQMGYAVWNNDERTKERENEEPIYPFNRSQLNLELLAEINHKSRKKE